MDHPRRTRALALHASAQPDEETSPADDEGGSVGTPLPRAAQESQAGVSGASQRRTRRRFRTTAEIRSRPFPDLRLKQPHRAAAPHPPTRHGGPLGGGAPRARPLRRNGFLLPPPVPRPGVRRRGVPRDERAGDAREPGGQGIDRPPPQAGLAPRGVSDRQTRLREEKMVPRRRVRPGGTATRPGAPREDPVAFPGSFNHDGHPHPLRNAEETNRRGR